MNSPITRALTILLLLALGLPLLAAPSAADRAFTAAKQLLDLENAGQAAAAFEKFLVDYPKDPRVQEATFLLGRSYQMGSKLDEALTAYTKVVQRAPSPDTDKLRAVAFFQMAECYWQQQVYDKAASSCQQCLKVAGADVDLAARAWYWLGKSQVELDQYTEAGQSFAKVEEVAPAHPLASWSAYAQGIAAMRQSDFLRAVTVLERVMTKYKDSDAAPEATLALGLAYAGRARASEATRDADFGKAVQTLTAAENLPKLAADSKLRATLAIAEIFSDRKEYDRAEATYARAINGMLGGHPWLAEARLLRGHALYNAERYADAATEYARVTDDKNPGFAQQALYWLGNSDYQLAVSKHDAKACADAIAALRRFLTAAGSKHPQAPRAALLLALCLEEQAAGKAEARADAVAAFKDVLANWPSSKEAGQAQSGITRLTATMTRAELEKVAAGLPTGAASWNVALRLAQEQFAAGNYQEALDSAKKVLADKPAADLLVRACYLAGAAAQRLGKPDAAITYYQQVLANAPDAELTLFTQRALAQAYLELQQYPKAREAGKALLALPATGKDQAEKDADMAGRNLLLAEAAIGDKQYKEASEACNRVLTAYPNTTQAPYAAMNLAWIAETTKDTPGAIAAYRTMTGKYPTHKQAPDAWFRLGLLLNNQKEYQPAIDALKNVPKDYPQADQAMYAIAWAYLDLGKPAEATAQFEALAKQFPKSPLAGDGLYHIGASLMDQEKFPEAQAAFERALQILGTEHKLSALLTYKLAACAFNAGDATRAAEAFGTVATKYPTSEVAVESLFWQGQALEARGEAQAAAARTAYQQYLLKAKDGPLALDATLGAGRAALTQKQYTAARTDLKKALELSEKVDPKNTALSERAKNVMPEAQYLLGQSFFAEKNYPEALTAFAGVAVYALEPWYSRSLLQMARCSALQNDAAAATKTLKLLLKLFPDSDSAKEAPKVAEEYKLTLE